MNTTDQELDAVTRGAVERTWALVTVTFNSSPALNHFWTDVELPANVEWVVVDNGSEDDSAAVARGLGARVIALRKNVGFGAANNIGFNSGSSEYVGFVNPDVRPRPETLAELASLIDERGAIIAPQLLNSDGSLQPNGRGDPYLLEKIRNRMGRSSESSNYRRFAQAGQNVEVSWLMGAVVLGSRSQFAKLGPWDERFFVYYEDSDLGLRARAFGIPSLVSGTVNWIHGWARETTKPSWNAWRREIPSLIKFYSRYPRLLGWPRTNGWRTEK